MTATISLRSIQQFVNEVTGEVVGNDRGDTYFFTEEDLANLAIFTPRNYEGVLNFTLTAVAVENDGDLASSESVPFSVTFLADENEPPPLIPPPPEIQPEVPQLIIGDPADGANVGVEDALMVVNLTALIGEGDISDPVVTVTLSNIPEDFEVRGALYNPLTDTYTVVSDPTCLVCVRCRVFVRSLYSCFYFYFSGRGRP